MSKAYKNNYKNNYKKKSKKISNKTKSILITVGMVLLIFALLAGVYTLFRNKDKSTDDGYSLCDVQWRNGKIDADGTLIDDKEYMYSSKIDCKSVLKIERDIASNVLFVVYYYDDLSNLVYVNEDQSSLSEKFKGYRNNYEKSISDIEVDEGETIDHARVVVKWLENDDNVLSFFEIQRLKDLINIYTYNSSEE